MSENTSQLTNQNSSAKHQQINQMRIMHIDLDYLYDKDNKQQTRNIQVLIQRIQALQPNTLLSRPLLIPMEMVLLIKFILATVTYLFVPTYLMMLSSRYANKPKFNMSMHGCR